MDISTPSPTARRIAKTILNGFDAYFADFQNMTLGAKARFEKADWQAVHEAHRNRIDLYKQKVMQVCELVRGVTSKDTSDIDLWAQAKLAYAQLVSSHSNYEIAETFFNSIFCRIFRHRHIHERHMFVKPSRAQDGKPLKDYSIYISYRLDKNVEELVSRILDDFEFSVPWENKKRDVANIVQVIEEHILADSDSSLPPVRIDILESVFYRNKAAYLVGRVSRGSGSVPIILPLLNNENSGIYVDTVVFKPDDASIIFSFTRSYFMVDAPIPSRFVRFIKSLMPQKEASEVYNSIGFNKHGKTEFYRNVLEHMKHSDDKFVIAPGIKGMVMSVFTLPSYGIVFKIIKDKFDPPKTVTEEIVRSQYRLVSRSDRAGRMADTQEYSNFIFYRNRFSQELLEELQRVAPSKLEIDDKRVIIKHLYTERRMTPLNLYLRSATDEQIYDVMDEYGNAIKQLAAANIFTGDMLLKNFGVTRHGRVVFYDYDEIAPITECNFRKIPEPRNEAEEMADRPWYTVAENDIFPEEFRLFFSGNPTARKAFEEQHRDLYDYRFWQRIKDALLAGQIGDTFPYRRRTRFERADAAVDKSGTEHLFNF
ncbi:bifunctional isocitrate dehydrogenase kinase/phosphatase [Exilibacterium tricleocarpae]|uniref:Isocitrate dehydrogenase kinase/phosphatase n=1 Tax=Exilibacterium tricleocarpae TaxID=2591008 RepID=A0A545TFS6_9GAMM|nr:bifunctional isocitrate dehydrogenase kinase/phosphatase [Exilibacterium tricleocarpae]TQV76073.1 bifunctional isocitrate dehydrogenase kinase/phosphatase [Exilibacterium tricleocarpae]